MIESAGVIRKWREHPVTFVRDVFAAEPDEWQADMLEAFPNHNRLGAVACKGPGKTAALAWLGWNFLATRPHCKVPCTSITGPNLADGLWTEFSKWQKKSPLLSKAFTWTKTRIFQNDHPETWWASARSWAQDADPTQQANTLAGLHEDYLLFLIDEVSEIPDGVVSAAEAALTGGIETKLVIMGNATRTDGPLYRAYTTDRALWFFVRITGDPDDPKRSPRIDIAEARRQIAKYGRDAFVVKVNILGEFPDKQADKLLAPKDITAAMQRVAPALGSLKLARRMGLDVARFGDDDAILAGRCGDVAFPLKEFDGKPDNVELAQLAMRACDKFDADAIFIDGTGNGSGVVDVMRHSNYGHLVREVHFGMRAMDSERFENKRAEMYWEAAEWVREHGCLPNDPLLFAELAAPIYWFDKKQRICLESKDDIKARLGRSPDRADAFVLTFAGPVARKPASLPGQSSSTHQSTVEAGHETSVDDDRSQREVF